MKKFGGWLAGVVGSIIVGYAVWYLTIHLPAQSTTTATTTQPAVTTFEGMVYSGSAPVAKAMVMVQLTGSAGVNGPVHDITDENGAYRIEFTGLPNTARASLSATATGYEGSKPREVASPLPIDSHVDLPLTPVVQTPVGPQPQPAAPIAHLPLYVPKLASKAIRIQVPPKAAQ